MPDKTGAQKRGGENKEKEHWKLNVRKKRNFVLKKAVRKDL